jgi:hypothetical protein
MEFQGRITSKDGSPMGTFASVQAQLIGMFPGLVFKWSSSGIQKLADIDSRGIELPSIVRRTLEAQPSSLCGSLDDGRMLVTFNVGSNQPVICIWVTVSGDNHTVGVALALLERRHGWIVDLPEALQVVKLASNQTPYLTGGATLFVDDSPEMNNEDAVS